MLQAGSRLGSRDAVALAGARLEFPDPDAIAPVAAQAQQDERTRPN
jgi:hypothetical protein